MKLFIRNQIRSLNHQFSICLRSNFTNHSFYVMYSIFLCRSTIEFIKVLPRSTDINIKYIYICIRIFFSGQHGMLCRIHAANFRAIRLTAARNISAANTLDKNNCVRMFSIRRTQKLTAGRAGCIGNSLKFQRGYNIWALSICILIKIIQFNRIKSSCYHNCTITLFDQFIFLCIINSASSANLRTQPTFTSGQFCTIICINGSYFRHGLSKRNINSPALIHTQVELIRYIFLRAFLRA